MGSFAVEDVDLRLLRAGQHDVAVEGAAILRRQVRLVHVDREQLAVKPVGIPPAAGEHGRGVGARRHADQNPLLRAPRRLDAVQLQVRFELLIDDVGCQQEGALPELRQPLGLFGGFRFRRCIDDDDFFRLVDERLRHRLAAATAGDPFHEILLLVDVLDVERGDDRDARGEQLVDVLIALRVTAAGRIVVREAVHQADLRAACEDRGHVDDGDAGARQRRDHVHSPGDLFDVRVHVRLHGGDDHVFTALAPPPSFVEHAERLADTRGVAKEDLQRAAHGGALGRLHVLQQRFGIGTSELVALVERHQSFVQLCARINGVVGDVINDEAVSGRRRGLSEEMIHHRTLGALAPERAVGLQVSRPSRFATRPLRSD